MNIKQGLGGSVQTNSGEKKTEKETLSIGPGVGE